MSLPNRTYSVPDKHGWVQWWDAQLDLLRISFVFMVKHGLPKESDDESVPALKPDMKVFEDKFIPTDKGPESGIWAERVTKMFSAFPCNLFIHKHHHNIPAQQNNNALCITRECSGNVPTQIRQEAEQTIIGFYFLLMVCEVNYNSTMPLSCWMLGGDMTVT